MKKLATVIGAMVCLKVMKKPKRPARVVNYYFIKKGCGGHCNCGNH